MLRSLRSLNASARHLSTLMEHQAKLMSRGLPKRKKLESVKKIICVGSGKGGVGKSTVSVNVACTLANSFDMKVGLLDADIYGPSVPKMMNLSGQEAPELTKADLMIPLQNYNVKCMSMGFLVDEKSPVIWRGLMIMNAIERLIFKTDWSDLDVLVIDLPPGTGDIQLSITQNVHLNGAIIVTTPQDIALIDARKALEMFKKIEVPVIGVVQNMSVYKCTNCGHVDHIFGDNGATKLNTDIIGNIPIDASIMRTSDAGEPLCVSHKSHYIVDVYKAICENILKKLHGS
jgi:ATP-binding protein involved in chromosome partitioning